MTRGSDKHSPMKDDELEKEMEGRLRGNHPTRADESLDAEPPADDDPGEEPFVSEQERPER
ncbi:hypothetical protein A8924_4550 [Saccharopolyspora erythraea NRRL 2338]|uniref:Uncharacterized protein n=2 Tax=Saccharopolyspora erythraea TaxID=1836 RepID=A4FHA1_SACEN|nr:hypothetical protein [Saccharopolyspora erythraea]EQD86873.1 hypothetical protein N599_07280 [Saccharopolyspora erythraea D]PFG97126.1 hypothetical protein A8924_4550 [Saccharopolyspora erythraea NRRL 2338]QRK87329.1 hypothetical protein JQX30_21205 [Saccharopolyspora erythraea]CAM03426.1 hypothetical protein SACE_4157 [Saccharopolyspora erythraea NRRL 2338]